MAALVMLTGRLSGHPQAECDLRPSNAQDHSVIDQDRKLALCLLLHNLGALDPFEHLGRGQPGEALGWAWRRGCCLLPLTRLSLPGSRIRPALRSSHAIQHAGRV
jgi:hypothetical protein